MSTAKERIDPQLDLIHGSASGRDDLHADGTEAVSARPPPYGIQLADAAAEGPMLPPRSQLISGQALPSSTLSFFEAGFKQSLHEVRVHAHHAPVTLAGSSRIATVGNDIFLGTDGGRSTGASPSLVLAHELAHVVQQRGGNSPGAEPLGTTPPTLEAQANNAATNVIGGQPVGHLSSAPAGGAQGWDSFEHVAIGDTGPPSQQHLILLECHEKDLPEHATPVAEWPKEWQDIYAKADRTQKRAMERGLTYGEVIALSGDFYEGFDAMSKASFREIIGLLPLIRGEHTTTAQLERETGGRYLTLAKRNLAHFSNVPPDAEGHARNNIGVWKRMHVEALRVATSGDANQAWARNGAADHFLSDAFSAGHIRQARAALVSSDTGQLKAKAMHDLDNAHGVKVENSRGRSWTAYGDDHWKDEENDKNVAMTVQAMAKSKADIEHALEERERYRIPIRFDSELIVPHAQESAEDTWSDTDFAGELMSLAGTEGPSYAESGYKTIDDVRAWIRRNNSPEVIARQPFDERKRMVDTLFNSFLISEHDIDLIDAIISANPVEREKLRNIYRSQLLHVSDIYIRPQLRAMLERE